MHIRWLKYYVIVWIMGAGINTSMAQEFGRNIAENELLDLLVFDGDIEYGIVQASKYNDTFCVFQSDFISLLGYEPIKGENDCLTEKEIEALFNLKVSIDISKMRVLLEPDQTYPLVDMFRAKQRHLRNVTDPFNAVPFVRVQDSTIPRLTGIGIDVGQSNLNQLDYSKISSGIQIFGGNLTSNVYYTNNMFNTLKNRFYYQNQWRWYNDTDSRKIQHIYLGNAIGWTLNQEAYDGLYLSNKNNSQMPLQRLFDVGVPLKKGSIIEWNSTVDQGYQSMIVSDPMQEIPLQVQYGLNTLNFKLTEPGSNSQEIIRTIFIPNGMISKGQTAYEIKIGRMVKDPSKWIVGTTFEHGISNRLNVLLELEQHRLTWNQNGNRFGFKAILFEHLDVVGKINAKREHDVLLSYRNSSVFNFSLRDVHPSIRNQSFNENLKRFSQFQWTLNLPKSISLHGVADRRKSTFSNEFNSSISASHSWRYLIMRSQLTFRSIHLNQNIDSKTKGSTFYIGKKINRNYILSLESQLSHGATTRVEAIALRTHYVGPKLSLQSTITRLPGLDNTIFQIGFRNQGRHMTSNHNLNYSQHEIHHWSMHAAKWGVIDKQSWVNMSTSSMDLVGIQFIAFHDENMNGKKDHNEITLNGLQAVSTGTRVVEKGIHNASLVLSDMIPKNNYRITFEPELLDHQDLMVYHSNMLVQAPSSGIQTIYVPCVPGEELAGKWSSEDISISSSDLMAVLKDERSGNTYKIEFFNDQTWIVHRIPQGKYTVVAHNRNGDLLKISSKHVDIPIIGTERELTLHFETT